MQRDGCRRATLAGAVVALALLGACGQDDGAGVREAAQASGATATAGTGSGTGSGSQAGSASGAGSGSEAGSGSGLSSADLQTSATGDAAVQEGAKHYQQYVVGQVDALVQDARAFTDAVRGGDVAAAKREFAPSRQAWERIEPIAGLVEELDGKLDARVDDFASETDAEWTGWHRLEHLLWERNTTRGATPYADQLDRDLATLRQEVAKLDIPPAAVALGAGELIEEISKGKITGEEDRYSKTDLWDIAANLEGSKQAVQVFRDELQTRDAALLKEIDDGFAALEATLARYRSGEGYRPFTALSASDKDALQSQSAALAETLSRLPAALGVA